MQSEFIVLRKTPYRENALVLSGISPDFGKLEVIAYGAAGSSKPNSFPVADIYRVLSVTLKDNDLEQGKNGLLAAKDIELIEDFPDLPRKLDNLKKQLQEAIQAQEFEQAAKLRDEIKGMEG